MWLRACQPAWRLWPRQLCTAAMACGHAAGMPGSTSELQFFDAHCHLQLLPPDSNLSSVQQRAAQAGVIGYVLNGTHPDDWEAMASTATTAQVESEDASPARAPCAIQVARCIGVHPYVIGDDDRPLPADWPVQLSQALQRDAGLGVGESGLHKLGKHKQTMPAQVAAMKIHCWLARVHRRPITLHCVQAWGAMLEALTDCAGSPDDAWPGTIAAADAHGWLLPDSLSPGHTSAWPWPEEQLQQSDFPLAAPVILHGFAGPADMIPKLRALGCYFSLGTLVTSPHAKKAHAAAEQTPLDRMLLETDSPDGHMWTEADESLPCEPSVLPAIAVRIAELRACSAASIAEATTTNATRVFHPLLLPHARRPASTTSDNV